MSGDQLGLELKRAGIERAELCECGCGQPAPIAPCSAAGRGYVKGEPRRFIQGHQNRRRIRGSWTEQDRGHSTPCWIWTGALSEDGYGRVTVMYRHTTAHRYVYESLVGPIPDGLHLDHLCRVPACVNPAHLEPVTVAENARRGVNAKLTAAIVREIRASTEDSRMIAERLGVAVSTIRNARNGSKWADIDDGKALKEAGIARAESRAPNLAETVRAYLREIASDGRAVDIDDARDWLDSLGIEAPSPAWWGCIFRSTEWELVGFSPSRRPAKHAHRNSRWKLRNNERNRGDAS